MLTKSVSSIVGAAVAGVLVSEARSPPVLAVPSDRALKRSVRQAI